MASTEHRKLELETGGKDPGYRNTTSSYAILLQLLLSYIPALCTLVAVMMGSFLMAGWREGNWTRHMACKQIEREPETSVIRLVHPTKKSLLPFSQSTVTMIKKTPGENVTFSPEVTRINDTGSSANRKQYLVHWHNAPTDLKLRPDALACEFTPCTYNNCRLTFDRKNASISDAVLFDGRAVHNNTDFERPVGQIWIFAAHESPASYMDMGGRWAKSHWRGEFNWTMTYDNNNTDIHLPYGGLLKNENSQERNFTEIAWKKTNNSLIINSHCQTRSKREDYVKKLNLYSNVTTLGGCGTPWKCGRRYVHDTCFDILNTTYRFYLAFENAFCSQYFTEKFYENFNYDIIQITRGGMLGDARKLLPKGTYISTDDFASPRELAEYLNHLAESTNDYAALLKEKSKYYSPRYKYWYQRALCEVCERLNHQDKYRKHIPDITEWASQTKPCRNATDIL